MTSCLSRNHKNYHENQKNKQTNRKATKTKNKQKTKITQNYKTYNILFMNTACTQNIFIYCNTSLF